MFETVLPPVILALGSNLGDRMGYLRAAVAALAPQVMVGCLSPVYESTPMYVTDQPRFLNMALQATTHLMPAALLNLIKDIESNVGRQPGQRFGPRVVDIDIIFYGKQTVKAVDLEIPHPRMTERRFVLQPICDIAPDFYHVGVGQSVQALLAALPEDASFWRYAERL